MYILGYIYHLTHPGTKPEGSESGRRTENAMARALRRGWVAIRRRQVRASVERTLRNLPDWALSDIGVHRSDISDVAAALAREEPDKANKLAHPASVRPASGERTDLGLAGCG